VIATASIPAHIAVDYWAFLADASATSASGSPSADAGVVEQLQRAHSLYRGPLAEGSDQAWILTVREATRRTFLAVTARLVRPPRRHRPGRGVGDSGNRPQSRTDQPGHLPRHHGLPTTAGRQ
jgi:transcriptional activator